MTGETRARCAICAKPMEMSAEPEHEYYCSDECLERGFDEHDAATDSAENLAERQSRHLQRTSTSVCSCGMATDRDDGLTMMFDDPPDGVRESLSRPCD